MFQPSFFKVLVHRCESTGLCIFARRDRRSACNVLTFLNSQAFCSPHYPVDTTPTRSDLVFSFRHIDSNFGSRETFIYLGIRSHVELHAPLKNRVGERDVLPAINNTSAMLCYLLCSFNDHSGHSGFRVDVAPVTYFF